MCQPIGNLDGQPSREDERLLMNSPLTQSTLCTSKNKLCMCVHRGMHWAPPVWAVLPKGKQEGKHQSYKTPNLVSPVINQKEVKWKIKPGLWEALQWTHRKSWVKVMFWLICSVRLRQSGYWKTGKWLKG